MEKEFEVPVNSVERYVKEVLSLGENLVVNAEKQEELLFRGQDDKDYLLLPAIAREFLKLEQERNFIEMVKYKFPSVFYAGMDPVDLLALLQHHGVPTRLLDITSNPLVALFFACKNEDPKDGEVIVFKNNNYDVCNYPIAHAIADSYRFSQSTKTPLERFCSNVVSQPYYEEKRISMENMSVEERVSKIEECCKKLIFVRAQERSSRQKLQQGQFILFPNRISPEGNNGKGNMCFEKAIDAIPKDKEHIEKRFIISGSAKKEIKKKLKMLGISKATLFADNVDMVCEDLSESLQLRYGEKSNRAEN